MRHAIGVELVLLLVATGEALAAGTNGPPCRSVSWVRTGRMIDPRYGHAATLLPSGKVLVAGAGGNGLATAELYDPATGTWSVTGSMSTEHAYPTLTLLTTGKVLVVGENTAQPQPSELYDPDTGQWTKTGAMLLAREHHTATLLPMGKVLVAGGYGLLGPLPSAELYDLATGEWRATGALSTRRFLHTATLLPSGQVLVVGGVDFDGRASRAAARWVSRSPFPGHTTRLTSCTTSLEEP